MTEAGGKRIPEVTVVMPTHDRAHTLARAVDSVRLQEGVDWELVVADDGSLDDTLAMLAPYLSDPRIRVIRLPHGGVSAARNAAVAVGMGAYLAFLDSDDEWLPGMLAAQMGFLKATGMGIVQSEDIWIRKGVRVNPPAHYLKKEGDIFAESLDYCMITPSSVMMTRELFEATGGFRTDFPACEDYELWLRITSRHPVGLIRRQLLKRYGGNPDQLSTRYPAQDRFRIRAIALLLEDTGLAPARRGLALAALGRKLDIYEKGCRRRGKTEDLAWCRELKSKFWENPENHLRMQGERLL